LQKLGFVRQGVTDLEQIDFKKVLVAGNLDKLATDFATSSFSVDQQFLNGNAGFEYAFDSQEYKDNFRSPIDSSDVRGTGVRLDLTTRLPDGRDNPNVGRPFVVLDNPDIDREKIGRESHRVTTFVKFDAENDWSLPKILGKIIGRHTVTGFYNTQTIDKLDITDRLSVFPRKDAKIFADSFNASTTLSRSFQSIVYVGPSMLNAGSANELVFSPPSIDFFRDDRTMLVRAVDVEASLESGATETVTKDISVRTGFISSGSIQNQVIDSKAVIMHSHWLSGNVVTMFGWRDDETKTYFEGSPPLNFDRETILSQLRIPMEPTGESSGSSFSSSVVVHSPIQWKMPLGAHISLHYSQSENFQPVAQRVNALGMNVGSPAGETKDFGFSLSLLEDKFNIRVNLYDAAASNVSSTEGSATLRRVLGNQGIPIGSLVQDVEAGLAPESVLQKFIDTIPEATKKVTNAEILFAPDGVKRVGYQFQIPGNMVATEETASEGTEIELTYSPTPNWRIAFNAAQQKAALSNLAPGFREFYKPFILLLPEVENLPISPGDPETIGFVMRTGGILPFNALVARDNTAVSELREWRWTAITNYQFSEGRFQGLGVGAAIRWQDSVALGFPLDDVDGVLIPDLGSPYMGETQMLGDVWVSYQHKVFGDKTWDIQLNLRNIGGDNIIPIRSQPDGSFAQVRYANAKRLIISTGISF